MQKALVCYAFFPHARAVFRDHNPETAHIPDEGLPRLLYDRRRALSLSMYEVARHLGVTRDVVRMWERGEREPRARYYPAIIAFLDDDSWLGSTTLSEQIKRFRLLRGWSQKRFGEWLGYSERTIGRWEDGLSPPADIAGKLRTIIGETLARANDPATDPGKK